MKKLKKAAVVALSASMVIIGSTAPAMAAGVTITNGDFSTGAPSDTVITGWTTVLERVDLGVSSIAGCATRDTSTYTTLRDWQDEYDNSPESSPNDNPTANNDTTGVLDSEDYEVTLEDGNSLGDFVRESQVIRLFSDVSGGGDSGQFDGYVVHGPAVFSEPFSAKAIDDLSFKWAASDDSDDFHVFGYLVNTATCAQTEALDATGEVSAWRTKNVAVPTNGTYRFVFVAGTYDASWGGAAGAVLYLDDVSIAVNEERAAQLANTGSEGMIPLALMGFGLLGAGVYSIQRGRKSA